MATAETKSLEMWAHVVLEMSTEGATIPLPDGREASIKIEEDCLIAYTYEGDGDERVIHQLVRLVVEEQHPD